MAQQPQFCGACSDVINALEAERDELRGVGGSWFVYVNEGRHRWRFVFRAESAHDASDAIHQAWMEACATGNEPAEGEFIDYMAVPQSAVTTCSKSATDPASS